jgi:hypothetical protein
LKSPFSASGGVLSTLDGRRRLLSAAVLLALGIAELSAGRRLRPEQANALSLNLDRVAINDLADIITLSAVQALPLTEVFRQAAKSRIIVNAHRINQGLMPRLGRTRRMCPARPAPHRKQRVRNRR